MSWEAVGAIGQAVSALALVIVIVQFRHTRSESRRALNHARAEALREQFIQDTDERVLRIALKADAALRVDVRDRVKFVSALIERAGLTLEEAYVKYTRQLSSWTLRQQNIPNVHDLPAAERRNFDRGIQMTYGQPGIGRLFFETYIKPTQPRQ